MSKTLYIRLRQWCVPPQFSDEEETRLAGLLHIILLSTIAALIIFILVSQLMGASLKATAINSGIVVVTAGLWFGVRQGHAKFVGWISILVIWGFFTASGWLFGGLRDSSFIAFVPVILVASLVLGRWYGLVVALITILMGLWFAYAEGIGLLITDFDTPFELWRDQSLNIILTTLIFFLTTRNLQTALERVRRDEEALTAINQDLECEISERTRVEETLQEAHVELEQRVAERTVELSRTNERLKQEIEERRQIEQELRRSQERLLLAIEGSGGGLWDEQLDPMKKFDDYSGYTHFSAWEKRLLGYEIDDPLLDPTLTWDDFVLPEDRARREKHQRDHFDGLTQFMDHEYRVQRSDGAIYWVHGRSRIIRDEQGRPLRWIGIDWNITARKEVEQELQRYREQLEELVQERTAELIKANEQLGQEIARREQAEASLRAYSENLEGMVEVRSRELQMAQERLLRQEKLAVLGQLAGGVGHELRNPLGVISNAVYFLDSVLAEADETILEYLDIIATRVQEAEKIVADLLNLSRTRVLQRENTAVSELVSTVLERHPPPEVVTITTRIPPDLPPVVVDAQQIGQVLANLITNAYQAMSAGGTLSLSAEVAADQVRLTVADTGHGMSAETLGEIFEPLFTTKVKGIGLGLIVSKNLVEVNGGRIQVKSVEGQGSTFMIFLPLKT